MRSEELEKPQSMVPFYLLAVWALVLIGVGGYFLASCIGHLDRL